MGVRNGTDAMCQSYVRKVLQITLGPLNRQLPKRRLDIRHFIGVLPRRIRGGDGLQGDLVDTVSAPQEGGKYRFAGGRAVEGERRIGAVAVPRMLVSELGEPSVIANARTALRECGAGNRHGDSLRIFI